jgi:glycosyltransferase involved in cell wall biosynthesis
VHVAFVTHAYPRWEGDVAGAFLERLAMAIGARGHRVTVITPADEGRGGLELRHGVEVRRVRYAPAGWETLAHRGTLVAAARTVAGVAAGTLMMATLVRAAIGAGADLLHAHWWIPSGLAAWGANRLSHSRYVVTLHGTDVNLLGRSAAARAAARRVLSRARAVTAVSSYLARRVADIGVTRAIPVQPMPLAVERYTRWSQGGGGVVIVGRLSAQKRVADALEAIAVLARSGRHLPVTIIGDGPERLALETLCANRGIGSQTRFLGAVEPDRLPEAMGDADLLAFPAKAEGLGLAAVEAFLLGIPVVASEDGGGVLDIVPRERGGRIVAGGDPGALARGIAELLDDPESRRHAREAGAALRERVAPDRAAARFEDLYQEAVR